MGQVHAGGIDIAYDVHGDGTQGTVLLVCGTGQPAVMWGALGTTDTLTGAGYQVVTFDSVGRPLELALRRCHVGKAAPEVLVASCWSA